MTTNVPAQRVLKPEDGDILRWSVGSNRYMADGKDTGGTIAVSSGAPRRSPRAPRTRAPPLPLVERHGLRM